jgi:itaconate CoA-transferase
VSRIVARLDGPVTTPRMDTHIVVTEFGWTDLKGKSSTERAKALIALARAEFQAGLTAGAKEMHLL